MLTLKAINDNPEEIIRKLAKKHFDAKELIAQIIETDARKTFNASNSNQPFGIEFLVKAYRFVDEGRQKRRS